MTHNLDRLAPADAEALLLAMCPRIGDHAPELARRCGYLPLALRVSAALLAADETYAVAHYLTQLAAEHRHHSADPDGDPHDPAASMAAALALSYAALPAPAQQAFAQLAVFVGSFDLPAALAVIEPTTQDALADTLALLVRHSLLHYDADTARYTQPDLLRAYGRTRMPAPVEREARLRHTRYYAHLMYHAAQLYQAGNQLAALALFDQERPQTDAVWAWLLGQGEGTADTECDELILVMADVTVATGALRYHLQTERIPQLEAHAAAARRLGRKRAEGNALSNLGSAHAALGDARQAITYHEQALAVMQELGDTQAQGSMLNNLGTAHAALGDARRAITYHEQRLALARELGDRHGEGSALGNLGSAHAALGDARQAITCYEQALGVMRELGDTQAQGSILNNLGSAHAALGDARQAITFYEARLALARELGDRRGEGSALSNLGIAYKNVGDARRAIPYHEQALDISRELGDRRGEGTALGNLGSAHFTLGDVRRAITFYEARLALARELGDRRGEGNALGNLGIASKQLGAIPQAIAYYAQQLVIVREIGDRKGEANACWNLGLLYEEQGELAQAAPLMQVAADFYTAIGHANQQKYTDGLARVLGKVAGAGD